MLLLPTGQVLLIPIFGGCNTLKIYTPTNPNYDPSWAPVICGGSCSYNQPVQISNNYTNNISGLRFNGMSQGAAFGDEYQSATNYPLVRITDYSGFQPMVYYCRTHDHTSMGVQTGNLIVSTFFDCPDVPTGTVGNLEVVANGIPSNPMLVEVVQDTTPATYAPSLLRNPGLVPRVRTSIGQVPTQACFAWVGISYLTRSRQHFAQLLNCCKPYSVFALQIIPGVKTAYLASSQPLTPTSRKFPRTAVMLAMNSTDI